MAYVIGVDIGGTFTDLVLLEGSGPVRTAKVPSTPRDLTLGVEAVLADGARSLEIGLRDLLGATEGFAHGTTIATNTFLEGKGARAGLITTRGFGDTIRIQRSMGMTAGMKRQELAHYSRRRYPDPLVPPSRVHEVDERVDAEGEVVAPLDESGVRRAARALAGQGVASVAVCFLWSFLNPGHERRAGEILREELGTAHVVLSADVAPVLGEYERTATTVVTACLGPPVAGYLHRLDARLRELGLSCSLAVLNSAGGVTALETVNDQVVGLLLSGPTAGVTASLHLAQSLGVANVITTDMGGTSFDVGLIVEGQPLLQPVVQFGKYHLASPMLAIEAIGAGGGSIARVRDGYLSVGPESAGADPGPACYDRGGEDPTVTDADLVLGVLDPEGFLGGRMRLDPARSRQAIQRRVAEPLGLDVVAAAAAIRRIADSQMGDLLRRVTVERGFDPADFVLFAYGGAGPTHCCAYAAELGLGRILVPATATVHSAYGAAVSDLSYTSERSRPFRTPVGFRRASDHWEPDVLEAVFAELEGRCRRVLASARGGGDGMRFGRTAEMRFRRQTQSLAVPVPGGLDAAGIDDLVARFEAAYERRYGPGSGYREAGVELVTCRVRGVLQRPRPGAAPLPSGGTAAPTGERAAYHLEAGRFLPTAIYKGQSLAPGACLSGPAIVQYPGTTVVIPPGWTGEVDPYLNVWILQDPP